MHADGSPIDTGLFGPDGFRSWPGTTPIVVVAVGLVVVAVVALVVGRRRRRSTVAAHGS